MTVASIRNTQTATTTGATSITVTKPTGTASGDVLLLYLAKDGSDSVTTGPTGFTYQSALSGVIGGTMEFRVFTRTADGSEGASFSFSSWGSTEAAACYCVAIRDTAGIDVSGAILSSGNSSGETVAALTTTVNDTFLVGFAGSEYGTAGIASTSGFTEVSQLSAGSGVTGAEAALYTKTGPSTAGTTGAMSWTVDQTQEFQACVIALKPSAAGSYSLTASTGTFALTGIVTGLKASRNIAAATQSYTLTGSATGLRAGRKLAATAATHALTGIDAALSRTRKILATTGVFTLTGTATGLSRGLKLAASTGSITLTDIATVLKAARKISAAQATFTLTGNDAALTYSSAEPPSDDGFYFILYG